MDGPQKHKGQKWKFEPPTHCQRKNTIGASFKTSKNPPKIPKNPLARKKVEKWKVKIQRRDKRREKRKKKSKTIWIYIFIIYIFPPKRTATNTSLPPSLSLSSFFFFRSNKQQKKKKKKTKIERMTKCVSPNAISTILANPSPESSSDVPEIVVQVIELKATGASGNRFM